MKRKVHVVEHSTFIFFSTVFEWVTCHIQGFLIHVYIQRKTQRQIATKKHTTPQKVLTVASRSRLFSLSWNPFYIKTYQSHDNSLRPIALTKWF